MLPAKPVNPALPVTALRTVVLTALLFASLLGAGQVNKRERMLQWLAGKTDAKVFTTLSS